MWLAIASLDARDGLGKIFLASAVDPADLIPRARETERIVWDTKKGGVVATKDKRIGHITLQSTPLPHPTDEAVMPALYGAISAEGAQLLPFNDTVAQWPNRVGSLKCWYPAHGWPDVITAPLLPQPETWLRSEERRVGTEGVGQGRFRWAKCHSKKKTKN